MARQSKIDVLEATRLTRLGRLEEAMAVLRGDSVAPHDRAGPSDAAGGKAPVVDLVPPSAQTGSAWTPPLSTPAEPAAPRNDMSPFSGSWI